MGVDITLGVLVFICAVRGWFKGFLRQAIPLGAVVSCVYLADPLRDLARPHAVATFPSIGPVVLDRLLWWAGAAVAYLLIAGTGLSIVKSMRKKTYGDPQPNRADQGAGFTLGAAKGAILAAFLAWALAESKNSYLESAPYIAEHTQKSRVMTWSIRYQPAKTIWKSHVVQSFVERVKTRGVQSAPPAALPKPEMETAQSSSAHAPDRTSAARPSSLSLPDLNPDSPEFLPQLDRVMRLNGLTPE